MAFKLTPSSQTPKARAKRWRAYANEILAIVLRHKRDRSTLVFDPTAIIRRPVYRAPVLCPICAHVVGSPECSHAPRPGLPATTNTNTNKH